MIIDFKEILNKKNEELTKNIDQTIVFTIKTNDREEKYCCIGRSNEESKESLEKAAKDFLVRIGFCDNYEIIDVRVATSKEKSILQEMLRDGVSEFEASERTCYSEDGSLRELIGEWKQKENDKKEGQDKEGKKVRKTEMER